MFSEKKRTPHHYPTGGWCLIHHLNLASTKWQIHIHSLPSTKDKEIKKTIIPQLSHMGELEKKDGTEFTSEEAQQQLRFLRLFFSFVMGTWKSPICAVGYDGKDEIVWQSFDAPRETRHPTTWFNHDGAQLELLFPAFANKFENAPIWCQSFDWYIKANRSKDISSGIILIQTALERLSYIYLVKEKHLITEKDFNNSKKYTAASKIRTLMTSLTVSPTIPPYAPKPWKDIPETLTKVRNKLVHPNQQTQDTQRQNLALQLGLWSFEECIFSLCGYTGNRNNRIEMYFKH